MTSYKIELTDEAIENLEQIYLYIAKADQMMYRTKNDYYANLMKTMC